jgi:hypothetical protein
VFTSASCLIPAFLNWWGYYKCSKGKFLSPKSQRHSEQPRVVDQRRPTASGDYWRQPCDPSHH